MNKEYIDIEYVEVVDTPKDIRRRKIFELSNKMVSKILLIRNNSIRALEKMIRTLYFRK